MKKLVRYVVERYAYLCFFVILLSNAAIGCITISSKFHLWNRVDGTYDCVTPSKMTRVPGLKFTYQHHDNCELFPGEQVSMALIIFYLHWYGAFQDPADAVLNNLNNLIIEWESEKMKFHNGYGMDGKFISEGVAVGLAHGKEHIQVYAPTSADIYETSLVHELVHVSIYASNAYGHGDPDHEGNKYRGWTPRHTQLISEVNASLKILTEANDGTQN